MNWDAVIKHLRREAATAIFASYGANQHFARPDAPELRAKAAAAILMADALEAGLRTPSQTERNEG